MGSHLSPFLSGKIALCVSNIDTIKFLTIPSLCFSHIAETNVWLPTTTTCMRFWLTTRGDLSNMGTEVSCRVVEVGTVAVATDFDASSELGVIFIYMRQQNLDLFTIALRLVVLTKGVK